MVTIGSGADANGGGTDATAGGAPSSSRPEVTASSADPARAKLASAAAEAKFRLLWALSVRLAPFIQLAGRLSASAERGRKQGGRTPAVPRRWYISHLFFWIGSGLACWLQYRRIDRTAARRHLIRSAWMPPLVWFFALSFIGMSIPDAVLADMVRNAPYRAAAP